MEVDGMKRLITTALQLCIGTTLLAQGWVADEASKDNSGGVFSGIMGLFLLIGAIWFFGYIMDKISEDRDIRERRKARQNEKTLTQSKQEKKQPTLQDVKNTSKKAELPTDFVDMGYRKYTALFKLTEKPKSEDIHADLLLYKMYDGDKFISSLNGAGTTNRNYDVNPKEGTRIICDFAYNDYENRFVHSLKLPNTLWAIGNTSFYFLGLSELTIPSSVQYITGNPFGERCKNVVSLSDSFSFEENQLLSREQSLLVADLSDEQMIKQTPPNIKYIGRGAYNLQKNLLLIKISPSVIAISDNAFGESLKVVLFQGRTEIVEPTSFGKCVKVFYVPKNLKYHYKTVLPKELNAEIIEMDEDNVSDKEILDHFLLDEDKSVYPLLNLPHNSRPQILPKDKDYIEKMKKDYALTEKQKEDSINRIIDWGEVSNNDLERPTNAYYSFDGKKLLDCFVSHYEIKDGTEIVMDSATQGSYFSSVTLPSSVRVIGNNVFSYCNLNVFIIPKSIEKITGNPFVRCSVQIDNHSPNFIMSKGVLYDKTKQRIISVLWNYTDTEYFLEPSVIAIERYSFYGQSIHAFTTIALPPLTKYIGESAFERTIFGEIDMHDGIIEIDKSAFKHSSVKIMTLPKSLQKLGESAFENCTDLEIVVFDNNLESIEERTFYGCTKLNNVYFPEGVKVLKKDSFYGCEKLNNVRFPNSLKRIKKHAFMGCPLVNVVLSRNTVVEKDAFPSECQILYRD